MNHLYTIIMSLGTAIILAACSLTPPSPPLPDGEYRPVNQSFLLNPLPETREPAKNLNGDES